MNIVINAVFLHERARGVGRVSNNIIKKLAELDKKNQYFIYYGDWQQYEFTNILQDNIKLIPLHIRRNAFIRNLYLVFVLPLKIKKHKPDVYHIMDTSPVFYKTCRTISTVHDLAEFTVPDKYNPIKCFFRKKYVGLQIKKSDDVITVSEYTKQDILNRYHVHSDKIHVIYNFFETELKFDDNRKYEDYFLIVGEIERTKNIGCVLKAFSKLPEDYQSRFRIKIVGRHGNDYSNVLRDIQNLRLEERVDLYNYVSDKTLFELYKNAYALIFASLFEGFGLPILEAMTFGIPVISSNTSSMPEVAGNAEILFNPYDSGELAKCMEELIQNPKKRIDMIENGRVQAKKFNADVIISQLLKLYAKP
jgi:glycosyltransferase involved in cell wall biosynthesis